MAAEAPTGRGIARLDGLFILRFTPNTDAESDAAEALRRLTAASPAPLSIQSEHGSVTIMPEQGSFGFDLTSRPSEALLPVIRDLVGAFSFDGVSVETTFRIQEYVGDTVREAIFAWDESKGVTLAARERPCRPDERPTLPESSLSDRAESFLRRYQWPLLFAAALLVTVAWFGWQSGWWSLGASAVDGPLVDAGVLTDVVVFTKARGFRGKLIFELRPGKEFARFAEVAKGCSLRPGIFRVVLLRKGAPTDLILPLDLRGLSAAFTRLKEGETVKVVTLWSGTAFDGILICE